MPRSFPVTRKAGLLALALLLWSAPAASLPAQEDLWPFGGGQGTSRFRGRDLWNLGLLGAKASDPEAGGSAAPDNGGGRRVVRRNGGRRDSEPKQLAVEILFPGGPAQKAGLKRGDVIVGLGSRPFPEGALDPLARALLEAEAGSGRQAVPLLVRRGDRKPQTVAVPVPGAGPWAAHPTRGKGRAALVARACRWLAEQQLSTGGYEATLSGRVGSIVQTCLAGLCWLAGGSSLKEGGYATCLAKAVKFLERNLDKPGGLPRASGPRGNWDQSNWAWAHAAIFLGELQLRSPSKRVGRLLARCAATLAERQEESGGWAHGPGGPNALGYLELNIMTGLALSGLGLAKQAGCEVDKKVVKKAMGFIKKSTGGDGGVGYSPSPGQRSGNIGRTAATWLGYVNLGLARHPDTVRLKGYVERKAGDVMGGHASLMQHVMLAGVASAALGGRARQRFWEACRRDLVLARAPDGSFQPRPWHESRLLGRNTDVTFGQVWSTAAWTLALGADPSKDGSRGLPGWCGR